VTRLSVLLLLLHATAAAADDLGEVMNLLAARRHAEAGFVEQHFIALLKRPLESWGELYYDAPAHLEKRTDSPRAESLILDGDVVTMKRGARTRVLDLHAYPQILPLVESLRATLAGDRAALERVFRVGFSGDAGRWQMRLEPLDASLAGTIADIRIDGARDELYSVDIREAGGDHSLMTIRPHPRR
jgi:hypothetical protein